MKKRLFIVLVVATTIIAISVLQHQDANASATATATPAWTYTKVVAKWGAGGVQGSQDRFVNAPNAPNPSWVSASVGPNPNGTQSRATAGASYGPLWVAVAGFVKAGPGDWAYGKPDTVIVEDSLTCQMIHVSGNDYQLVSQGYMRLIPDVCADETWGHFEVRIYERGNEENTPFWGRIALASYGPYAEGDYADFHYSDFSSGDTLLIYIADTAAVVYEGNQDSLAIEAYARDRATNVPTITQWGIFVLIGLIVASGVLIMLRRRKAAVPA